MRGMLITSRSFAEYRAMFDLATADLAGGVIDVCAGGSSFVAELSRRGVPALAVDPAYAWPYQRLAAAVSDSIAGGHTLIADRPDRFVWSYYGDLDRHRAIRENAAHRFLADLRDRPGGYVAGALPRLPLRDAAADLAVCSHLLFTWSDRFDARWHLAALRELVRVARREVRVFPLVTAGSGDPVPFRVAVTRALAVDGIDAEERPVPYEFQRGAASMLVLSRRRRAMAR
jgi:hypothetical protein